MRKLAAWLGPVFHLNIRRSDECATMIYWLQPLAGERILDIGCGDGFYSSRIARSGAHVIGIDIDRKRLIRSNLYQRNHLECREADAERMEFPDRSFDAVISLCVIEHFPHDDLVLAQVARVLKPGSRFLFSADSLSNPQIRVEEKRRHGERYAVRSFYTVEGIREKLAVHGFTIERAEYILTTPTALALVRTSWWLERLPAGLAPFRLLGQLLLGTAGRALLSWCERKSDHARSGLTLLVAARLNVTADGTPGAGG